MSLASLATESASTQRPTLGANGRTLQAKLLGLQCMPLYPTDPNRIGELMEQLKLETLYRMFDTIALGTHDVQPGDFWSQGGKTYLVRAVGAWSAPSMEAFTQVTVEEQLTSE